MNWITYFIKTPKVSFLLGVLLLVLGALVVDIIPKESSPALDYGIVTINTGYGGASALDVDRLITDKIESNISSLSGIDTYTSTSGNGFSSVVITLDTGVDINSFISELRAKVDEVIPKLPSDLRNDPRITSINSASDRPFTSIILYGNKSSGDLYYDAKNLQSSLEKVVGIDKVDIKNPIEKEVVINIKKEQLESLGFSFSQIQSVLTNAEQDTPIGNFLIDNKEFSMRFNGTLSTLEEIKNKQIFQIGNTESSTVIYLKDIADVSLKSNEDAAITRFYSKESSKKNSIVITASKKESSDLFKTQEKIDFILDEFITNNNDLSYTQYQQSSERMKDDFSQLLNSFLTSLAVVLAFIFIFIGIREGLLASLIIPLSFLGTIIILFFSGRTLNFMTNFSMILALGILVDTAIVIVEGIRDFMNKGFSKREAAIKSIQEFAPALFSGILTTITVFLPLFFLPGIVGQYLSFIPITVTIVLLMSLFVALILIPSYSSVLLKEDHRPSKIRISIDKTISNIIFIYKRILKWVIYGFFRRWIIFIFVFTLFILSFFLPSSFDFFPSADSDSINLEITYPIGTPQEKVNKEIYNIEKKLYNIQEIRYFTTSVKDNVSSISLTLFPMLERKEKNQKTAFVLEQELLEKYETLDDHISLQIKRQKQGPPSDFPVGFRVIMDSNELIYEGKIVVDQLINELKNIEGTQGIGSDALEIPGEIEFSLDKEKLLKLNIPYATIPLFVRNALEGVIVETFSYKNEDIDVVMKIDKEDIDTLDEILDLEIQKGVPLKEVVSLSYNNAFSTVKRKDGELSFTVFSFLTEDGNTAVITEKILEKINNNTIKIPEGVRISDGSENAENEQLIQALQVDLFLAIFLIFLILVVQFKSYSPPLLILQTIIFSQLGVNLGLFLTDTPRSMPYMLGIISLAGIVVNDAIILVDKIIKNIESKEFYSQYDAIINAASSRFIPVILTTLTTSAGIFPLVFIDSFWEGLAYTVIFGLSFATVLTLFLIPLGYLLFQRKV
jgi:multidrug efflux pump